LLFYYEILSDAPRAVEDASRKEGIPLFYTDAEFY